MQQAFRFAGLILISGLLIYVACRKEYSYEQGIKNLPPIAKAGKDTLITFPTDSIRLDGSLSFDPDGTITSFLWKKISGPASFTILNANNAVTKVNDLDTGIYWFELKVTDDKGFSAKDTINVIVDPASTKHAPVADAGYDQIIILPERSGILEGVLSYDLDNDITTYLWRKISGPSNFTILSSVARQTKAINLELGVYFFELTVTDATGLFSKDTVKITVRSAPNVPPVANAGTDITIIYNLQTCSLNQSSITLDGSASYDPDGTIAKYQWSLAFGDNSSLTINRPNEAITTITNLVPGSFAFKLEVTDNDGDTDSDTILVTTQYVNRPYVNARLIPIGNLSMKRKVSAVASANGKILFAGGINEPVLPGANFSSQVDIYDITNNTWSTAALSLPRTEISATTLGNKIFFAGGRAPGIGPTSRVDIYDAVADSWTSMEMPHTGTRLGSMTYGSKVFVAGGDYINIYDDITRRWTSNPLSQHRFSITPMIVKSIPNNLIYFLGGVQDVSTGLLSSRIDVYDPVANVWSTREMSEPQYGMIAISGLLAGGTTSNGVTNKVEGISGCLFQPNSFSYHSYGKTGDKLVFFIWDGKEKNKFDIFDISSNTWFIGVLDESITPSLVISVDNIIYVVGAYGNNGYYNQVWKLEF